MTRLQSKSLYWGKVIISLEDCQRHENTNTILVEDQQKKRDDHGCYLLSIDIGFENERAKIDAVTVHCFEFRSLFRV